MAVEGGAKCVKYLLFFFNFIFWLCGLALIVLGVITQVAFSKVAKDTFGSALVIIVLGVIIFFIAFFGCCGAWKENYCMVTMFAVILSLIIIVEIAAAIAGYIFRGKVTTDVVNKSLKDMITRYNTSEESKKAMDGLQELLKCCGANSSNDWVNFKSDNNSVPDSCCKNMTQNCGIGALHNPNIIFKQACEPAVEEWLKQSVLWIAVGALVIAFVQITGIVLACILMRAIRSGYEVM